MSTITVCTSCAPALARNGGPRGPSGGERLAEAIDSAARNCLQPPRIVRHECLWACAHACAILIMEDGKTGYLAGRFEATPQAAEAIVAWAKAHAESGDGEVPYKRWSEGIKGHFIARIPAGGGGNDG